LTPCWAGGADPAETAEIRVPSIRGQLRWWLRALFPNANADTQILGRADDSGVRASAVSIVVKDVHARVLQQNLEDYTGCQGNAALQNPEAYFLWPLRPTRQSPQRRGVLMPLPRHPVASFTLEWSWLPPFFAQAPQWQPRFEQALQAWSLLGTLGTRATRGYGSLWDASGNFNTPDDFAQALAFLPDHIQVRLLDGEFADGRQALAAAANWFRGLRLGSARYGGRPSRWGQNDHDVALGHGGRDAKVYRPALGLPLVQRFHRGPTVSTTLPNSPVPDRYPSPVHLKVVLLGGHYRVVLVVFARYLLQEGTELEVGHRRVRLSLELVDHIRNTGLPLR
jgi:hypothetical protein